MNTLLCFIPTATDASSQYRAMGPLGELRRQYRNLHLVTPPERLDWATLSQVDGIFMHRPIGTNQVQMMRLFKQHRIPVWIDYDDDLFCLPSDNPAHTVYSHQAVQRNVAELLKLADFVSVSTECLRKAYLNFNKDVTTIPNAFNFRLFPVKEQEETRKQIVSWRGSNTHMRDLMEVAPELIEFAHQNGDVAWNFIGYNPWFIIEKMPKGRAFHTPDLDFMDYMKYLSDLRPAVHLVPLTDHAFNRSKSNCAWLEASYAGAAVLAPNLEEWQKPGITHYDGKTTLPQQLDRLLKKDDLPIHVSASRDHMKEFLDLRDVNLQRLEILTEMGVMQ